MSLDGAAQRVLDLIRESGRPAIETLTPTEARAVQVASRPVLLPDPPPVALVRELNAPGKAGPVRLRLYRGVGTKPDAELPCLVYCHGGGWVICDLDSHDWVCRRLANLAGCAVISVDYRLAPEHKFPAAVEDAASAISFVAREGSSLGIDPSRIAVGGDSAGGNLAAVMALMARDGALPPVVGQVLIYPAVDFALEYPSHTVMADGYLLTSAGMRWFGNHYLNAEAERSDWRASPIRAAKLAGAAPAYLLTVSYDPLCDEGVAYATQLRSEGVPIIHQHVPDQMHGYFTLGRIVPAAHAGTAAAAAALSLFLSEA
jgi:acetyl esterase